MFILNMNNMTFNLAIKLTHYYDRAAIVYTKAITVIGLAFVLFKYHLCKLLE